MIEQEIGNYQGEKVKKYYELVKGGVENESSGVDANVFRYLKKIMPDNFSEKVVVDLGAGDGRWSKYFVVHGARTVYAVERSKDMINKLTKYDKERVLPVQADMMQLPLKDNSVDIGFSSFSMMYFNEDSLNEVVAEVSRVLKDSGVFYIATNILNVVNASLEDKLKWEIVPIQLGIGDDKIPLENIVQPIKAYKQAFQKNSFTIVKERHFDPEGVEIPDDYQCKKDIKLEKVVFVLEKKQDSRPEWMKKK